jgi:hypothetical protein
MGPVIPFPKLYLGIAKNLDGRRRPSLHEQNLDGRRRPSPHGRCSPRCVTKITYSGDISHTNHFRNLPKLR